MPMIGTALPLGREELYSHNSHDDLCETIGQANASWEIDLDDPMQAFGTTTRQLQPSLQDLSMRVSFVVPGSVSAE